MIANFNTTRLGTQKIGPMLKCKSSKERSEDETSFLSFENLLSNSSAERLIEEWTNANTASINKRFGKHLETPLHR